MGQVQALNFLPAGIPSYNSIRLQSKKMFSVDSLSGMLFDKRSIKPTEEEISVILLFYTKQWEEPMERLEKLIQSSLPGDGIEIYRTMHGFLHRLQHPPEIPFVIVLFAAGEEELSDIYALHLLLEGTRLILVLPDQGEETLKVAHRLRPRYITYTDHDFTDLVGVIQKMAKSH
jgi:hypothetical protein